MKDIGIYYKSTCCGSFLLYYILGSDQKFNVTSRNKELDLGTNKKLMNYMFYKQFQKRKKNLASWTFMLILKEKMTRIESLNGKTENGSVTGLVKNTGQIIHLKTMIYQKFGSFSFMTMRN